MAATRADDTGLPISVEGKDDFHVLFGAFRADKVSVIIAKQGDIQTMGFHIMKAFHKLFIGKNLLKSAACLPLLVILQQPLFAEGRQPDAGCPCQACAKEECHDMQRDADLPAVSEKNGDDAQDGGGDGKGILGWLMGEIHVPRWEMGVFLGNAVIGLIAGISHLKENLPQDKGNSKSRSCK